jgi:acyl-CoA thioesterase FadM
MHIKWFETAEEHLLRQQQLNLSAEERLHHSLVVKTSALRVPDR